MKHPLFDIAPGIAAAFMGAVLMIGSPTVPAIANDQGNVSAQEVITDTKALEEMSVGKVLLHYGEGFSQRQLKLDIQDLEKAGFKVIAVKGAPDEKITPYLFGLHYPDKYYTSINSVEMVSTLIQIGKANKLIPSDRAPSPDWE